MAVLTGELITRNLAAGGLGAADAMGGDALGGAVDIVTPTIPISLSDEAVPLSYDTISYNLALSVFGDTEGGGLYVDPAPLIALSGGSIGDNRARSFLGQGIGGGD